MTGGPPDVVVDYSSAWTQLTADDDVASWAPEAARQLWADSGRHHTASDRQILAQQLDIVARAAFVVPCFGAFLLCRDPSRGPQVALRLNGLRYGAGTEDGQIVDGILLPDTQQLLEPQVEHIAGPGLRRMRIRQRAWSEDTRAVSDHIAYVFPFDEGAWILSTSVPDPARAGRRLADLDELAAGVQLR